jgi:hypothetical protein
MPDTKPKTPIQGIRLTLSREEAEALRTAVYYAFASDDFQASQATRASVMGAEPSASDTL